MIRLRLELPDPLELRGPRLLLQELQAKFVRRQHGLHHLAHRVVDHLHLLHLLLLGLLGLLRKLK